MIRRIKKLEAERLKLLEAMDVLLDGKALEEAKDAVKSWDENYGDELEALLALRRGKNVTVQTG